MLRSVQNRGVRTHVLLVAAMGLVIAAVTSLSLLLIRHRLEEQVTHDLASDLARSVESFQNIGAERQNALDRETALLADLPSLKALMTTSSAITIKDGGERFWHVSGRDLFAIADNSGHVVAVYTKSGQPSARLNHDVAELVNHANATYLVSGQDLYDCAIRPIRFGSDETGTLLGYVISGVEMKGHAISQIGRPTQVDAIFVSNDRVLAGTLGAAQLMEFARNGIPQAQNSFPSNIRLGNERFLAITQDLSASSTEPLQLVMLKSFALAEGRIRRIDHLVLFAGLLALVVGTILMIVLSRLVTQPLEQLSSDVRAFGTGDSRRAVPNHGTQEMRELSAAFANMREEIQRANRALVESERLATIGLMASSVSHDLRHYLAAVYANAEFLASDKLSAKERSEIFHDIRTAVHGTTEMIESLLIFSRTGGAVRRTPEWMSNLVERAATVMRAHPDGEGVHIVVDTKGPAETRVLVDGKQVERAVYNLLLNACQSARMGAATPEVNVNLSSSGNEVVLRVQDNGAGVPPPIRDSLFQPFVSDGKQKGTGLGLTLAHCVVTEHGGDVRLISSRPGETIFQLTLPREAQAPVQHPSLTPAKVGTE